MEVLIAFLYLSSFVIIIEIIFAKRKKFYVRNNTIIFPEKRQFKIKENKLKGNIYLFHSIAFTLLVFGLLVRLQVPIKNIESVLLVVALAMIICLLHLYNQFIVKLSFHLVFLYMSVIFSLEDYLISGLSIYILIAMNLLLLYISIKTYIPSRH